MDEQQQLARLLIMNLCSIETILLRFLKGKEHLKKVSKSVKSAISECNNSLRGENRINLLDYYEKNFLNLKSVKHPTISEIEDEIEIEREWMVYCCASMIVLTLNKKRKFIETIKRIINGEKVYTEQEVKEILAKIETDKKVIIKTEEYL